MDKTNFFCNTLSFSWAVSATWLHVGASKKNELNTHFLQNFTMAHTESELDVLGVHRKLLKYLVHSSKRKN
jgi:hypothetical protein